MTTVTRKYNGFYIIQVRDRHRQKKGWKTFQFLGMGNAIGCYIAWCNDHTETQWDLVNIFEITEGQYNILEKQERNYRCQAPKPPSIG